MHLHRYVILHIESICIESGGSAKVNLRSMQCKCGDERMPVAELTSILGK